MFKRLCFVLSVLWAVMVLAAGLMPLADGSPSDNPVSKVVILAFLPMVIGPVLGQAACWVRRG